MQPLRLSWDADTALPIDMALLKMQLRIDHDEHDELLGFLHMPAAVEWAESEMHRSILAKTHYWVLADFPRGYGQEILLPRGKTQSVSSIVYAHDNTTTTLRGPTSGSPIGTSYREDLRGDDGGSLFPLDGESWPSVNLLAPAPVVITFSAGWTAAQVPADIKGALCRYVGDELDSTSMSDLPQGFTPWHLQAKEVALTRYRLARW